MQQALPHISVQLVPAQIIPGLHDFPMLQLNTVVPALLVSKDWHEGPLVQTIWQSPEPPQATPAVHELFPAQVTLASAASFVIMPPQVELPLHWTEHAAPPHVIAPP